MLCYANENVIKLIESGKTVGAAELQHRTDFFSATSPTILLDFSWARSKIINIPTGADVDDYLRMNLSSHLPYTADQVICNHRIINSSPEQTSIYLATLEKDSFGDFRTNLQAAGAIKPRLIPFTWPLVQSASDRLEAGSRLVRAEQGVIHYLELSGSNQPGKLITKHSGAGLEPALEEILSKHKSAPGEKQFLVNSYTLSDKQLEQLNQSFGFDGRAQWSPDIPDADFFSPDSANETLRRGLWWGAGLLFLVATALIQFQSFRLRGRINGLEKQLRNRKNTYRKKKKLYEKNRSQASGHRNSKLLEFINRLETTENDLRIEKINITANQPGSYSEGPGYRLALKGRAGELGPLRGYLNRLLGRLRKPEVQINTETETFKFKLEGTIK